MAPRYTNKEKKARQLNKRTKLEGYVKCIIHLVKEAARKRKRRIEERGDQQNPKRKPSRQGYLNAKGKIKVREAAVVQYCYDLGLVYDETTIVEDYELFSQYKELKFILCETTGKNKENWKIASLLLLDYITKTCNENPQDSSICAELEQVAINWNEDFVNVVLEPVVPVNNDVDDVDAFILDYNLLSFDESLMHDLI